MAPTPCSYGDYSCGDRMACFPSGDGGADGTCGCERFYGFTGPRCEDWSFTSWLTLALSLTSVAHLCHAAKVRVGELAHLVTSDRMFT